MKFIDIKLVISDIDGTILDDQHMVDDHLKDSLKWLRDKKIPFILASARSPKGIIPIAKELEIIDNPIACYNGALVLKGLSNDTYTSILSHELDKNDAEKIIEVVKESFPKVSISLYSEADWYVDKYDKWAQIEASITNDTPIEKDLKFLLSTTSLPLHKLLLMGEVEDIEQLLDYCRKLSLSNSSFYLSKDNYLEVTHRQVSKEKALLELSNHYNVPLENTMAIGDNYNDIPMLSLAGMGIAMGNAPAEVKNSANAETTNNNHNGVSNALKKYIFNF